MSIFLFVVCMIIPILLALYLSWLQAEEIEHDKLFTNVKMAIQRSRICLDEVYKTMDELDESELIACTPEHLQKMQDMVFSKRCVNEVQYLDHEQVKCGSAINIATDAKIDAEGFIMPSGTVISFDTSNFMNHSADSLRFTRDNYTIAVDKNPLTDIIAEPYIKIALVTDDGHVISTLNYYSDNVELIDDVFENPNLQRTDNSLVAVYRTPGFYYIGSEAISYVFKQWRKSLFLFLPFGLILSVIASGVVIWCLRRKLSDLGELKIAVARREFIVYYQPIIDFKTGDCIGAEALVRWRKPDGTMVSPDLFIPLAESSGLIQDITNQIIESIVTNLQTILRADDNLHISINVSVLDFNSKRIFKKLDAAIADTGIAPKQIWLEITERGFIDFDSVRDSLDAARKLGYIIVIDDFGTGYSSLSYLKELHIDVLKIDKSFIEALNKDSVTSNVTEHIIDLAKELHLKIVAEGVTTIEQVNYLQQRQVDFAQGWLYAKAMPLDDFIAFYQHNRVVQAGKTNV